MHTPIGVDVEHTDQLIPAVRVGVTTHGTKQLIDANVGPDDGVQYPLKTEVGDALETMLERVDTADGDGVARSKTLASEETEESGFSSAIRANEKCPRAGRKVNRDVTNAS